MKDLTWSLVRFQPSLRIQSYERPRLEISKIPALAVAHKAHERPPRELSKIPALIAHPELMRTQLEGSVSPAITTHPELMKYLTWKFVGFLPLLRLQSS
jgi:hypothetical protein